MQITHDNIARLVEVLGDVESCASTIYEASEMWQDKDGDRDDRAAARSEIEAELGDLTVAVNDLSALLGVAS